MNACVTVGSRVVGPGQPTYVIAEIGINHNGSLELAKKLIDAAALAGCDAVKFQKRTPALCTPAAYRDVKRDTPWGIMSYLEYRERIEFGTAQYDEIDRYCREKPIEWFASCWDQPSVDFISRYGPVCYKIASASVTDLDLLRRVAAEGRPVVLSTGMSTIEEIERAVGMFERDRLLIAHSTSTYPCKPTELNLKMIQVLRDRYRCPIGYSGHEVGLQTTLAAVVLGASFVERHITLDRATWGTDQAASIEPGGLVRLVRDVRVIESALGDGVKRVYDSERPSIEKLRRAT